MAVSAKHISAKPGPAFQTQSNEVPEVQRSYLRLALLVSGYLRHNYSCQMPQEMASMIASFSKKTMAKEGDTRAGVVVIGHPHSGKTALAEYLVFELGDSISYKLPVLKEERDSGHTTTWHSYQFKTGTYDYTLIDVPGCRRFVRNMIQGVSLADDIGILLVPAKQNAFEASVAQGQSDKCIRKGELQGQSRQHALIAHLMGVENLIVCINQMDDETVQYSQARYDEIKTGVDTMLTRIGYKTKKIPFIPISALHGDNIMETSTNMSWWKGFGVKIKNERISGVTLYDALEKVVKPSARNGRALRSGPFRMSVAAVHRIKGVGDVVTGKVEQGTISCGAAARFHPTGCGAHVFSMERHHRYIESAECGDFIGVNLSGLQKHNMPKTGDMMCIFERNLDPSPPRTVTQFTVLLFVQEHPGKLKCGKWVKNKKTSILELKGGYTPSVHVRTGSAPCQMAKIHWKLGKHTNRTKLENPEFIEAGDQAEAVFIPQAPTPFMVLPFDQCKPYGRVAMLEQHNLVILAKVIDVKLQCPRTRATRSPRLQVQKRDTCTEYANLKIMKSESNDIHIIQIYIVIQPPKEIALTT